MVIDIMKIKDISLHLLVASLSANIARMIDMITSVPNTIRGIYICQKVWRR